VEKSNMPTAGSPEKSKVSRWVVRGLLVFMVGMFVASVTPFGLAVWLGNRDEGKHMSSRIAQAPLHREQAALSRVFRLPVAAQQTYWREVSMFRPLQAATAEDKALWAVLHYDEAGFEAIFAQAGMEEATQVEVKGFLPWLLEDVEKHMGLKLSAGVEVLKLPAALFAGEGIPLKWVSAYGVPSQKSLLLMRFGAAEFVESTGHRVEPTQR